MNCTKNEREQGSQNLYLNKDGNPVAKNSNASHMLPKKGKKNDSRDLCK